MSTENGMRSFGTHTSRVYCQIAGRDITVSQCETNQGQEDCFACAAPSRRCEECGKRAVAVPETGLCEVCLTIELKKEWYITRPTFPLGTQVKCQQLGNREIMVNTCLSMQGSDECWNCAAPSRLCEECKARPVKIHRAGRCLICSVKEFAPDWSPLEDHELEVILDAEAEEESGTPAYVQEMEEILRVESITIPNDVQKLPVGSEEAVDINEEDAEMQEVIEVIEETQHVSPQLPLQNDQRTLELLPRVQEFVMNRDEASANLIVQTFHTTAARAAVIMNTLEKGGIVGPYPRGNQARKVLTKKQSDSPALPGIETVAATSRQVDTPSSAKPKLCKHCGKRPPQDAANPHCKTCRRYLWAVAVIQDPVKRAPLLEQTRLFLEDHPSFTVAELREHLHCGTDVTAALVRYLEREGYVSETKSGGKPRKVLTPIPPAQSADHDEPVKPETKTENAAVMFSVAEQQQGIDQLIAVVGSDGRFGKLLRSISLTLAWAKKNEEMIARIRGLFKQADEFFFPILKELGLVVVEEE